MIVLNLACPQSHRFEGWFANAEAFESQRASGLLSCPVCNATNIERMPSAPYVMTGHGGGEPPSPQAHAPAAPPSPEAEAVMTLLRNMARASEDVGERFPDEARRIHHGEAEARNIRGQADRDTLSELREEGIMVLPVPGDIDLH